MEVETAVEAETNADAAPTHYRTRRSRLDSKQRRRCDQRGEARRRRKRRRGRVCSRCTGRVRCAVEWMREIICREGELFWA